ncbi:MAG: polysaccharide biosynthesis C-terminal domain-containing protein [Phycisphaerales bacterium]|jgi:O-antigen/teichoic acid export membrane protein|nr:polysaccharide biosynthesis C-terminal domain-containing protein [Phycisphaerales bacterium]
MLRPQPTQLRSTDLNLPANESVSASARSALSKGFWSLADQGVVSVGNFATNILLARNVAEHDYGVFAILFGILLFLNSVHSAFVTYPLSVKGAMIDLPGLRQLAGHSLLLSGLLSLPLMGAATIAAIVLKRGDLAVWLCGAMLFWQLQETLRRALMAHLRYREAIWGDAIHFLGQSAVIFLFAYWGELNLHLAFVAMCVAAALGAGVQGLQLGICWVGRQQWRKFVLISWDLGRWMLLSSLVSVVSLQVVPWVLAYFYGVDEAGRLAAITTILGVIHPVLFGIGSLIVPAASRALMRGPRAAWRVGIKYTLLGSVLVTPYYLLVAAMPVLVLEVFYGVGSPYEDLTLALRMLVVCHAVDFLGTMLGSVLGGMGHSRWFFIANLAGMIATAAIALPLTVWMGINGTLIGAIAAAVARLAWCLIYLRSAGCFKSTTNDQKPTLGLVGG